MPLFAFPGEPRWQEETEEVEFDVEVGEYHGIVRIARRVFHDLAGFRPTPEQCIEYFHLHRTEFERAAQAKIIARDLTEDGNLRLTGRDLRRS